MKEETDNEQVLHRLFKQGIQHLETRLAYFSLVSTEKISGFAASLASACTVFIFAVLMLFFFSMGFAWWLGDYIGNRAGGFSLAGLIFVPISVIAYRWIGSYVRNKIIQVMLEEEVTTKKDTYG